MIDLNDYYYFVHVVEKQGFSQAAKALDMPKSRLSRHVNRLEQRLGARLIQRTSRRFHVTDVGQTFYRHARALLDEMEEAESAVQRSLNDLSGRINLSCSVGVAQYALKELLVHFLAANPNVEIMQQVTNQQVDLIGDGIDLAVRGHMLDLPDSSLIQRHLATVPWHLYAERSFLAKIGSPSSPYDLFNQRCLKVGWQSASGHWELESSTGVKASVPFTSQFCSDDMTTLKEAAMNGLGIVSLPEYTCRDEINSGKLVRVLPNWTAGIARLSLLMPSRQGVAPSVQALNKYLLAHAKNYIEGGVLPTNS
ncbi:LysR family transcriptional regulator [Aurantivibrio plasticivorans]